MRVLVIGYGSLLRGDDGVGQILAEALRDRLPPMTEIITTTQLTPEIAEPLSRADRAFFLDACVGESTGALTRIAVEPEAAGGAFSHNVTPQSLLCAARDLYGRAPAAYLITVTGTDFGHRIDLSPEMQAALPPLIETVERWVNDPTSTSS